MPPITLSAGSLRATVVPEVGAGLADFSVVGPAKFAHPLMRRAAPGESGPSSLSSFFMAPWCNRVANATFSFGGRVRKLFPNSPTPGAPAQHGDVRSRPFNVAARSEQRLSLELDSRVLADVNWPWAFVCRATYMLRPDALRVELEIENTSGEPFPAGCGHHPYFPRRLWHDGDAVEIAAPVKGRYPLKDGVATGSAARDALTDRLGSLRPVPTEHVDTVFGGFDASRGATIRWPSSGVTLTITGSPNFGHLVLFCPHADPVKGGSALPWIAVEPQTQVNGALSHPMPGDGTTVLGPGETLRTWVEFGVRQ